MYNKIVFFTLFLSSAIGTALAATCSAAQLKGTFSSFSLPGGGGSYQQGTNQVVSWNWATGAPVTQIKSVVIHGATDIPLASVTGIPVNFVSTQPDQAGAIFVTLPNPLAPGSYTFRVTLVSGGVECTIDSAVFIVIPGNNINECNIGDSRCVNGNSGFQICVDTPTGRKWGTTENCPAGQSCRQTGNQAQCTLGNVNPRTCTVPGRYSCDGDGFRICTVSLLLTDLQSCGTGNTCVPNGDSILCVPKGGDECVLGDRQCLGPASFRECVRDPATGFTRWSGEQPCARNNLCSGNGICAPPTTDCTSGHQKCTGTTTFQTCVNKQFGPDQSCGTGTVCRSYLNDYIICGFPLKKRRNVMV